MARFELIRDGLPAYPLRLPDPDKLDIAIEALIALRDAMDGDSDREESGLEDGFGSHPADGPGCPIADPGEDEDSPRDAAWIERLDQTERAMPRMSKPEYLDDGTSQAIGSTEDAEEDDGDTCGGGEDLGTDVPARGKMGFPGDGAIHDENAEPEEDRCQAGDDGCGAIVRQGHVHWGSDRDEQGVAPRYGVDQSLGPLGNGAN